MRGWIAKWCHARAVAKRKRDLIWLSTHSRQVAMAWQYELAYIERTGRLDWVDPHPMRISPPGSKIKPVPRG